MRHALTAIALLLGQAGVVAAAEQLTPIFDGKSLSGWEQKGGKARYRVEDGTIVGATVPNTPNSFLCTKKHYRDFILEYEFKCHAELNSGVQIRSNSLQKYKNGRVHGYQVEIDANKPGRMWVGGIYDEGRRGWLYPGSGGGDKAKFTQQGIRVFKKGQWNHVRVRAVGPSIQTWLNGQLRTDLRDDMTASGFIGLQVHGVGRRPDPIEIRWRNIRIQEIPSKTTAAAPTYRWQPLFDGKTLTGWTPLPGGTWTVKNGVILGTSTRQERRHGMLLSNREYGDFSIRLQFRTIKGCSGLYFRTEKTPGAVAVKGFQAEIDPTYETGGLYETGGRGWVVKPPAEKIKAIYQPGQWTRMQVTARGRDVTVLLNGQPTAELKNDSGRTRGYIGLQMHGGQDMHVEF
ncbi:MAG: DUF1080 domain-containing protein, partial [Phycisphaerae bacterium]|nr:DUF1080 domain-containing protein [Phycisphaerae bacterium]